MCENIRPEAIGSPNGHIQNEVEILIERSIRSSSLTPRIVQSTVVNNIRTKVTTIPHVLTVREAHKENLLQ
jgi:hypothetical protein